MSTHDRRLLTVALAWALLISSAAYGDGRQSAQAPDSLSAFASLSVADKHRVLDVLLAERTAIVPGRLAGLLGAALNDQQDGIRERALWAIARRAGSPADAAIWEHERPVYQGLRRAIALCSMTLTSTSAMPLWRRSAVSMSIRRPLASRSAS